MPKSNHRGASYAGHVDASPHDVAEPQWQPAPVQPEQSAAVDVPEPSPAAARPRARTRKR